jgi:hypothetical protein
VVEGAPLLREYRLKRLIEGSNPSLSAKKTPPNGGFFLAESDGARSLSYFPHIGEHINR